MTQNIPLQSDPIEVVGEKEKFVFKRLNVSDVISVNVRKARLMEGLTEDQITVAGHNLAHMVATLEKAVVSPQNYEPANLFDFEPLNNVWEQYTTWVDSFREVVEEKQKENSTANIQHPG